MNIINNKLQFEERMGKTNWREKVIYALYIFAILNTLVSTERVVFDVLGQMWITLFVNGLTAIASVLCILGLYFRKKSAIIAYIICALVVLAVNVVIVLIYNDVGILSGTEQFLGLSLKTNSWWKEHGFLCYPVCSGSRNCDNNDDGNDANNAGSGGLGLIDNTLLLAAGDQSLVEGSGDQMLQSCFVSYTVIETFHASVNTLLTLITILLAFFMICKEKKDPEEESFRYMGIGRYGGNAPISHTTKKHNQQTFYKLSDSFDTIGTLTTAGSNSSSSSM